MRRNHEGTRVRLKHIKRVTKPNGRVFLYLAIPGHKMVRLPDAPVESPEFLAAYAKASAAPIEAKGVPYAEGSVAASIISYQRSNAFLSLAEGTRRARRGILSKIASVWGKARVGHLREDHIVADISRLAPHVAVNRLKVWRAFCEWAVDQKMMKRNPAKDVDRPKTPKSDGHEPWTAEDIEAFRNRWQIGTSQRLAMELIYWTAARASDAVRLGPGMIDKAGWLVFKQEKTGGEVSIPFSRDLPDFARSMADDLNLLKQAIASQPRHMTWVVTAFGSARSVKAFSQWFSKAAGGAELPGVKSAHGLRKSRAIVLAESGATVHQIAAWTGHETLAEVQRYAKKAERRRILSGTHREQILETASDEFPKTAEKS